MDVPLRRCVIAVFVVGGCGPSASESGGRATQSTGGTENGETLMETASTSEGGDDTADGTDTWGDTWSGTGTTPACEPTPQPGADPLPPDVACDAYYNRETPSLEVMGRIVNETAEPIVVLPSTGPHSTARHFDVTGTMGGRSGFTADPCSTPRPDFYECAWHEPGGKGSACLLISIPPHPSILIQPGGTFVQPWHAWFWARADLPPRCGTNERPVECLAPVRLGPGTYEAAAFAATQAACGLDCDCTPTAGGWCEVDEWAEPTLEATAVWDGECEVLDIVFE